MKKYFLSITLIMFAVGLLQSQIKIGNNPQNIDASSVLELESNSGVLVITRVSDAQMNTITPLQGAIVYNNDIGCVFYYNGTNWLNLCENTVNASFEIDGANLVLTDSSGDSVSVTLSDLGVNTFSSDPVFNPMDNDNTIVITEVGDNVNIEVGEITGFNIADFTINGFFDIQDRSIPESKLAEDAITSFLIDVSVAGNGLTQAPDGSLAVDLNQLTGTGNITSTDLNITGGAGAALGNVIIDINPDAVGTIEIAPDAITTNEIALGAVEATDIAADAVNAVTINPDVAGAGLIQNATTGALEVDPTTVTADGDITSTDLNITGGVDATLNDVTIEINPDAIGTIEIADDAVQVENILNGTANQVLRTNAAGTDVEWGVIDTNSITGQDLTATDGSITVATGTGATLIASSISVAADGITNDKIADDAINTENITDGQVQTADINADAIDNTRIADDAVQVENILNGTANQVLRTNAAGTDVEWGVIDTNSITGQDLTATDGSITVATGTGATLIASSISVAADGITNDKIADDAINTENITDGQVQTNDLADLNVTTGKLALNAVNNTILADDAVQIENILNGTANQVLVTNTAGTAVEWTDRSNIIPTAPAGALFFSDGAGNLSEIRNGADTNPDVFWDATNNRLGIGTTTPLAGSKLHVAGPIRSETILNSPGTLLNPAYGFSSDTDTNTGIYFPAQDQLGFVVGEIEAINVREVSSDTETTINGSLELTEQLLDENGNTGNTGDVLTATATGVQWQSPQIVAMGKYNPSAANNLQGATVTGSAGNYQVTLANPIASADYIIQLTVEANHTINFINQTANTFDVIITMTDGSALGTLPEWFFTVTDF